MVAHSVPSPQRRKTLDLRFGFRGYWSDGGVCRIRVFETPGVVPVVVCTELDENTNTSVTNLAEHLAAEVIARFLPHRFEADPPVVWVEHYPARTDPRRKVTGRAEFDRVTFASWTPKPCLLGGVQRTKLGGPDWQPLTAVEVAALVGIDELQE